MKKQDNKSLIQEVTKRLDWYTMEASDEEFDADEVQTLLKLLDSLIVRNVRKRKEFWRQMERKVRRTAKQSLRKSKDGCTNSFGIFTNTELLW